MMASGWPSSGRNVAAALSVTVLAAFAAHPARALAGEPAISAEPALQPAFNAAVPNYVTRCDPGASVHVTVRARGNPVAVDAEPARVGLFATSVTLAEGQAFTIRVGSGANAATYNVRCLPPDFPEYSAQVLGPQQAAYYLTTPDFSFRRTDPASTYVALFDGNGVPVWWYHLSEAIAVDADLDPDGDLSWAVEEGGEHAFGLPGHVHVEVRNLNGELLDTLNTAGSPTDFHEAWPLANGNFLIDSYALQSEVPVSLFGNPFTVNALDASFQEVEPDGAVAYAWSSAGHISPSAGIHYWYFLNHYPGVEGRVWDYQHINAVMPYGEGYLVSLRNNDAIYYIQASTGDIVWKLGGTPTPQSLKLLAEPGVSTAFTSQHDVRTWPDGTVSFFDNGTREYQQPRVMRFRIAADTATLIQTLSVPEVQLSACCGSARLLPGGDWVVAWGASPYVDELTSTGTIVFRLKFLSDAFTYRAVPILPGQLSLPALIAGMNAMYPRTPGGSGSRDAG
jgi:arylsulfotransferase ASST